MISALVHESKSAEASPRSPISLVDSLRSRHPEQGHPVQQGAGRHYFHPVLSRDIRRGVGAFT